MTASLLSQLMLERHRWHQGKAGRAVIRRIDYRISQSGCYECRSGLNHDGYRVSTFRGRQTNLSRILWELAFGPIPDGMVIRHKCDNPTCIRIDHLLPGTHADNVHDCDQRGRRPKGEIHYRACLSNDQAREILALRGKRTAQQIADRYGVSRGCVEGVFDPKRWKHIKVEVFA